jgi:hypothetical protein
VALVARQTARVIDMRDRIRRDRTRLVRNTRSAVDAAAVTASPASDTVRCSDAGAGSSQNHEAAPVKPAVVGLVLTWPGLSASWSAVCSAIVTGVSGAAAGPVLPLPVIVKHGNTELGAYMQTWPAPSWYQNDPEPTGCVVLSTGELAGSGGYEGCGGGASVVPPIGLEGVPLLVWAAAVAVGRDRLAGWPDLLVWTSIWAPAAALERPSCCENQLT